MKSRSKCWMTTLFTVALFKIVLANGRNTTSRDQISTEFAGRPEKITDLERSETSYAAYNAFASPRDIFLDAYQSNNAFTSAFSRRSYSSNPGINAINNIHQVISCGDTFHQNCRNSRYRSYDGSCNNLQNPTWGMANTRYGRLLSPKYGDGIQSPTISVTGSELPLARLISNVMFPAVDIDDPIWTLVAMQWGQIITHDMALIDGTTQAKRHATRCCTEDGQLMNVKLTDKCYPMIVPYNDPFYTKTFTRCLNFVRSTTDLDRGCSTQGKPAEQITVVTQYLDLSLVYGSSDQTAASLRAGVGGRLIVDVRSGRQWPPSATNKSATCDNVEPEEVCYRTGDVRTNQNPQLAILQIILLREHNRIAEVLAKLNPHWTDETIFQETRRILIAMHQHISYYEWLPIFLGTQSTYANQILYNTEGYVNDYNPKVPASVLNEHSTAAFRYFHSLIAGFLDLVDANRFYSPSSALRLSDYFNRPSIIEENNNMDDLTRGMSYQPQKASDQNFDTEITQFLFRNGRLRGSDLRAVDIQRNRDHGLASYNDLREYCGLPRAKDFRDITDYISVANADKLSRLYASVDDIDLTVGASLEQHVGGSLAGPTFLCILVRQFYRTRVGDRFWYERGDNGMEFTLEQLAEIRKSSISRLFCDNGDNIQAMQPSGFRQVSNDNPIMSCDYLPSMDLSQWKDYAPESRNQGPTVHYVRYKK